MAALRTVFDHFGWFGVAGLVAFENATSVTPSESIQLTQFVPWFLATLVALGGLGWLARRLIQPRLRPALAPVRADDGD